MLKKKKPVLDEREMLEMYRIEHAGLWMMYALLCAAIVVQVIAGASLAQMAGELVSILAVSVVMIIANVRQGIWDENARPSVRGNAVCALVAGVCVAAVVAVARGGAAAGLAAGGAAALICFVLLTVLMHDMKRRQKKKEDALEEE